MVIPPPLMTVIQALTAAATPSLESTGVMRSIALPPSLSTFSWNSPGPLPSLQLADPEAVASISLSPPAIAALIAGAVMLTFLVWWETDRLGHRDLFHMHEFHKASREFQKAAGEAVQALRNDYHRVRPAHSRMNFYLGSMTGLRRDLQAIHRFRLDIGGDDPRILRELDQEIEESRNLVDAVQTAYDLQLKDLPVDQSGKVVRLANRRKDPGKD